MRKFPGPNWQLLILASGWIIRTVSGNALAIDFFAISDAERRGCNRRWELAGINPAVLRQQIGHTSAAIVGAVHRRDPA